MGEHTFGIETSIDVTAEEVGGASVGVVNEWTSGEEYSCQGGPGQTVCTWVETAYTVYEVRYTNDYTSTASAYCQADSEAKFPNANNAGGKYYCGYGKTCQHINAAFWGQQN